MQYLDKVICNIEKNIAVIKINNPPVNSLSNEVMDALNDCFLDLYENNEIRAVILTGEGRTFVAGADIKEFVSWTPEIAKEMTQKGQQLFTKIENYPRPVIAAINGHALGGGLELALVCDIRISSETAKFGLPEVTLGIIPGYGGSARLPRIINEGQAKKMIFTGEIIDANEAKNIGLVQELVPKELILQRSMELATKIKQNAPIAISNIKRVINIGRDLTLEKNLDNEAEAVEICFNSQDKIEGIAAFTNKRKARFINK